MPIENATLRSSSQNTRRRVTTLLVTGTVALFIALGAWALSSPTGSSPDEGYHLVSIWCAQDDASGHCAAGANPETRQVPAILPAAPTCFAFNGDASAACQGSPNQLSDLNLSPVTETATGNMDGGYPPIYYWVAGLFAGDNANVSTLTIRFLNAGLFATALGVLALALRRRQRMTVLLPTMATLVPFGMFLIPSINPSSWALFSASIVFPAVVGLFAETSSRIRQIALAAIVVIGTLVGAGARADGAVYAVFAIGLGVFLTATGMSLRSWKGAVVGVSLIVAIGLFATANQADSLSGGLSGQGGAKLSLSYLISTALDVPNLWQGAFGGWYLGWLDTPLPYIVNVVGWALFFALVFAGLQRGNGVKKNLAMAAAFAAIWFVPWFLTVQSRTEIGYQVQPRYILPLLIILLQVAMFTPASGRSLRLSAPQWTVVVGLLSITNSAALHTNLRRYITGLDTGGANLDNGVEWWWAAGPGPMTVWFLGSLAFTVTLACYGWYLFTRSGDEARTVEPDPNSPSVTIQEAQQPVEVASAPDRNDQ